MKSGWRLFMVWVLTRGGNKWGGGEPGGGGGGGRLSSSSSRIGSTFRITFTWGIA